MNATPKHKVFVSFHHEDEYYKNTFVDMMEGDIVDKSVEDGDIDDTRSSTETIRQKIRDEFIRDATVTVVLIGPRTWQRKHVDWEIGSSLRKTSRNPRCGLLGILLPNHTNYRTTKYSSSLIPPRLADNCGGHDPAAAFSFWSFLPRLADNCGGHDPFARYDWSNDPKSVRRLIHRALNNDPFARIYDWSNDPKSVRHWIHRAFERRSGTSPNNGRAQFGRNRSGECSGGWTD